MALVERAFDLLQRLERQVARLRPIDKGKQVERRLAKAVLAGEADLRDDRTLVAGAQLLGEPGRLGGEAAVAINRSGARRPCRRSRGSDG